MRRWILALAGIAILAGMALAQRDPAKEPRFEPAEVISAVDADYPPTSVAAGTVVFEVTIGPSGEIERIRRVREIPSLTESAERALKQWKFRPATLDGKPVRSRVAAAFSFTRPVVQPMQPSKQ